jgi:hypothetical protein
MATGTAAAAISIFVFPSQAKAWGVSAERLIANKAVDTLPPEIRGYFEANRDWLGHHVAEPLDWLEKNPLTERRNHFLYLDRYGKFPFDSLPRDYKAAVTKFTKSKLEGAGVLPWEIGVYSQKLTMAFRDHDWEQARISAAYLPPTSPKRTTHFIPRKTSMDICPPSPARIFASDRVWWTVFRCFSPCSRAMRCF